MVIEVGDIIKVRFQKFTDGTIDTNLNGHYAVVTDVNEEEIEYVFISSKKHKYVDRIFSITLNKEDVDCIGLKSNISYVKTAEIYHSCQNFMVVGYITYEEKLNEILNSVKLAKEGIKSGKTQGKKLKVVSSIKKYENKSKTKGKK